MHLKRNLIKLLVAAVVVLPFTLRAQTSSVNAHSPFSMYGIGEQNTPGALPMRSMGGAGVAWRGAGVINMLNPAGYSAIPQKSFLFNFGVEGQNYYNSQSVSGVEKSSAYNTFNFHDIAFQMPLAKKIGLGFSLSPYSSVGYDIRYDHPYDPDDPVSLNKVQYNYVGDGDITELKLGIGWEVFKNFSIGVAAQYYWGDINREFMTTTVGIIGNTSPITTAGKSKYSVSRLKGQVGVQWVPIVNERRALTVGATYDFGGDLKPSVSNTIYASGDVQTSVVQDEQMYLSLSLPKQFALGANYQTPKWTLLADYVYQGWGSGNKGTETSGTTDGKYFKVGYTNTSTIKLGVEYIPSRYDIRHFLKRWSYRVGFRYGDYNQTFDGHRLAQYAVTAGFGIPVKFLGVTTIDVGLEFGRRGYNVAERIGLVRQQYFKFAVGFTLFAGGENQEYWFLRPKYD